MTPKKDAYGQEVLAFMNGKKALEIVKRDDGFVDFSGGAKEYFKEFNDWPEIQKKAIKLAKGKILDIGAGAGRISLYLQGKGFEVTAIDSSPLAIEVCRKRGVKNAKILPIECIEKLMPNKFDTLIMVGNNFGLFGSFKKAKSLLRKISKITSPNALIIAESNNPYSTKDLAHLSYHKLNLKRGRMSGQLRIRIRFRKYIGEWFDYLLVSKKEMKKILRDTGWKVKKFINSKGSLYIAIIERA